MTPPTTEPRARNRVSAERLTAAERRESILDAAAGVFGELGYAAATTDRVANAAGISQPYVVRMFGGKERLFAEVLERALDRMLETFRRAVGEGRAAGESPRELKGRMGEAYEQLVAEGGVLLPLMQAFLLGHDPVIGPLARRGFLDIFRMLRDEARFDAETIQEFLSSGMLMNTMLALRMPQEGETDADAAALAACAFLPVGDPPA